MNSPKTSFKSMDIPLLLTASAVALMAGLVMPAITIKQMLFMKNTFSVLTGLQALWNDGQKFLAILVLMFSVIFPITKLALMFLVWVDSFGLKAGRRMMKWLSYLGKWSMLDVFVVAMTIVIAKISTFADATARPGIYIFGVSIALAIIAGMRLEKHLKIKPSAEI